MSSHHPHSPSILPRHKACPGSFNMCLGIPEGHNETDEQKAAKDEGTLLHARIVTGDKTGLTVDQSILVDDCIAFMKSKVSDGMTVYQEREMSLLNEFDIITSGTGDVVIIGKNVGFVIDWKMGRVPVTCAKDNIQLKVYARMAADEFGLDEVTNIVYQPRIRNNSEATFSKFELDSVKDEVIDIIAKTKDGTILKAGDHCRYCPAKGFCVEYQRNIQGEVFEVMKVEHASSIVDPAMIGEWVAKGKKLSKFFAALEFQAKSKLLKNEPIPGLYLQAKRGSREAKDVQGIFNAVSNVIPIEKFLSLTSISLAELDDIYARTRKEKDGTSLKQCKTDLAAIIEPYVERKKDQTILKVADEDATEGTATNV